MQICDLHTHSTFSDGSCTPTEIINEAIEKGLCAVALCDHNTVDGVPEFLAAAKDKDIEAIAGVEFSVDYMGVELHLLALFIPEGALKRLSELMVEVNRRKEISNIALVESLCSAGYVMDYSDIKRKSPNGNINRVQIATELTEKGYTASINEAFDTLLNEDAGYYVAPERINVFKMIGIILSLGAVPVLAHPFLNLSEEELTEFLPKAKECGLAGMECLYSTYSEEQTKKSLEIAQLYRLKPSGGSDYHGNKKPDIKLGIGKGGLKIPYEYAKGLKTKAE